MASVRKTMTELREEVCARYHPFSVNTSQVKADAQIEPITLAG